MNLLVQNLVVRASSVALITTQRSYTWADVGARVASLVTQFWGVRNGTRVGLRLQNAVDAWFASLAVWQLGGTVVPISKRLTPAEVAWILSDSGVDILLKDPEDAFEDFPGDITVWLWGSSIGDLVEGSAREIGANTVGGDEPAVIMYTSGTSGKSKAVPLSWENLVASALASAVNLGLHFDDVWLCCLPVNHIGGLSILLRSAIYGTAVEIQNGFEVDAVSQSIATNATLVSLVPTMLHRLIRDRNFEASLGSSRLRGILLGGASANLDDVTWCRARGVKVFHTYGMTESASQITTAHPEAPVGCSGLPVRGASVSIRDANFRELAPGEVGTIHISGPMVMRGYLGHPEENMRRFREGWFDTNDVGYLDKYGQLYVLSRREDLIVSGGENVYPAEVESVLLEHPEVAEVAVFGLPDEEWGQLVCAAIVWRSEPVELDSWLLARLAKFKHPRRRYALDGLPKTSSGKVMRAKLREMFLTSGV